MHLNKGKGTPLYSLHCPASHREIWLFFPIVILSQGHDYLLADIQEWMIHCTDENVAHKNIIYIKDRPTIGVYNVDLLLIKQ